jgi:hypothetical protein
MGGYSGSISYNKILDFDEGIHLEFCMNYELNQDMIWFSNVNGIYIGTNKASNIPNATFYNSQSNGTTIDHLRHFGNGKGKAVFIEDASTTSVTNSIFEGGAADYAVYFKASNNTVVKGFTASTIHIEASYNKAAFFIEADDARIIIDRVYSQYDNKMVDTKCTGNGLTITISNWEYITGNSKFCDNKTGNGVIYWYFERNQFSMNFQSVKDAKFWLVDAEHAVPYFLPTSAIASTGKIEPGWDAVAYYKHFVSEKF